VTFLLLLCLPQDPSAVCPTGAFRVYDVKEFIPQVHISLMLLSCGVLWSYLGLLASFCSLNFVILCGAYASADST
jgi:hypothetical protein